MKTIQVSDSLARTIYDMRSDMSIQKEMIANTLSSLAELIHYGRDEETVAVWTDDLLRAMFAISQYNALLNDLIQTTDHRAERFRLSE